MLGDDQLFLDRFVAMLQVPSADSAQTMIFRDATHEELCRAFSSWFNQLQLLFGEPVQVSITQGLHDQGIDVMIESMRRHTKLAVQIKSYGDIGKTDFQSKVMSQITYSKKHSPLMLLIVLSGDLNQSKHETKIRTLLSELSQIGEYVLPLVPERAFVILDCYRRNEHPLTFIKGTKEVTTLAEGLARALSNETYAAGIELTYHSRELPDSTKYDVLGQISFKPGASTIRGLDLIRIATQAGQPVTIPADIIGKLTFIDKNGKTLIPPEAKTDWIRIIPDIAKVPPMNLVTADPQTGDTLRFDKVQFVREKVEEVQLHLVSNDSPSRIQFNLAFDFSKNTADFYGNVNPELADVRDGLNFMRFMSTLYKSKHLELRNSANDELLIPMEVGSAPEFNYGDWINLLENLCFIQDTTVVKIPMPSSATSYDLDLATSVVKFLKDRTREVPSYRFTLRVTKSQAKTTLKQLRENGVLSDIWLEVKDFRLRVFNQDISLGPIKIEVPLAHCLEDPESLQRRCEALDESEQISMDFVCDEKPAIMRLGDAQA